MHLQHRCIQNALHLQISNDDIQTIAPTICVIQYQEEVQLHYNMQADISVFFKYSSMKLIF